MRQLEKALLDYKCVVTALQETRVPEGVMRIGDNFTLFNSNVTTSRWSSGVGFAIANNVLSSVVKWVPVNDRLCLIVLRAKPVNICIINCHAPTEEAEEEDKNSFYSDLERLYGNQSGSSVRLVIGDLNAKIGQEAEFRPTIGPESLHEECNENGMLLVNFATMEEMIVSSTFFPRKLFHKGTWVSPDGRTVNQIDHVLVDKRHRSCVENVRTFRGADMSSDHFLVVVKIRVKLSTKWRKRREGGMQVDKGKLGIEEIRAKYQDRAAAYLKETSTLTNNVDNCWTNLRNAVTKSATLVLGNVQYKKRKPWFDAECEEAVKVRNLKRLAWLEHQTEATSKSYAETRRTVCMLVRKKKREHKKQLLTSVEEAKSSRNFFRMTKYARGIYRQQTLIMKDDEDNVVPVQEQAGLFGKFFDGLLNVKNSEPSFVPEHLLEVDIEVPELRKEEVLVALRKLRTNKAPGNSDVSAELLQSGGDALLDVFSDLMTEVWRQERMPEEWRKAVICPIFKKGDASRVQNYRGIALLEIGYKILTSVILERLKPYTAQIIGSYQCGFSQGRSTSDLIFVLRQIAEKYYEFDRDLHIIFVDFKQAYDSIDREALWKILTELGIPMKYVRLIQECYKDTNCQVRFGGQLSESFNVENGLRQGDPLAPTLFNLALEKVRRELGRMRAMEMMGTDTLLAFADDVVIVGETADQVIHDTARFMVEARKVGLIVNDEKTKYMVISRRQHWSNTIAVDNHTFQRVDSFKYLGSIISSRSEVAKEVNQRMLSASRAQYSMDDLLKSKLISQRNKCHLYLTLIRPILIYGCETWATTLTIEERLRTFERKILRKIFRPVFNGTEGRWERRSKEELYQRFAKPDVVQVVKRKRLQWLGHVLRAESSLMKKVFEECPDGKRPVGRPRTRWKDVVVRNMKEADASATFMDATNRDKWTQICDFYLRCF